MKQLYLKHVTMENKCGLCDMEVQGVAHALIFCQTLKDHWRKLIPHITLFDKDTLFLDTTMRIYNHRGSEALEMLLVVAWSFWHN